MFVNARFLDLFDWVDQSPPLFAARSLISPHPCGADREKSAKTRSEFQYGGFRRPMAFPAGAKGDDIRATCTDSEVPRTQLPTTLVVAPDLAVVLAGGNDPLRPRLEVTGTSVTLGPDDGASTSGR